MPQPLVSICCAAYNHEQYIAAALDGMLAQKTSFPIEILVNDDCSTDGTPAILRAYAEKYPTIVKPLFQTENQYSKKVPIDPTFNYPRALGKYIALCEGDDYWSDENKLQRQADYMEAHPDCTFMMTNAVIRDADGLAPDREFIPYSEKDRAAYFAADHKYTLGEMCGLNFVPTASFLFRKTALAAIPAEMWGRYCPHGDLKLRMFMTAAGYGFYQHAFTSVYRENVRAGAMHAWSRDGSARAYERAANVADMLADVNEFSKGEYAAEVGKLRDWYLYVMLWNADSADVLRNRGARRVYRSMPFLQRARFRVKHMLPRAALAFLRGK